MTPFQRFLKSSLLGGAGTRFVCYYTGPAEPLSGRDVAAILRRLGFEP